MTVQPGGDVLLSNGDILHINGEAIVATMSNMSEFYDAQGNPVHNLPDKNPWGYEVNGFPCPMVVKKGIQFLYPSPSLQGTVPPCHTCPNQLTCTSQPSRFLGYGYPNGVR